MHKIITLEEHVIKLTTAYQDLLTSQHELKQKYADALYQDQLNAAERNKNE